MPPTSRDRLIVELVARFKQLRSGHVRELVFHDKPGRTNADRALSRLVRLGMLARIEVPRPGGAKGGSGQYVYQLGRAASAYYEGRWRPVRTVNYHSLAIADTFLTFRKLQWEGKLELFGMSSEPDSWRTIGNYQLKPDLLLDIQQLDGARRWVWFEVDQGSEGQGHIKEKLTRYWQASLQNAYDREQGVEGALPRFPAVVWVAVDEARERELAWLITQMAEDARKLFRVTTLEKLPALFTR